MTKWARIINDVAVEVIDFNPDGRFSPALIWSVVQDDCLSGARWDGFSWVDAPIPAGLREQDPNADAINLVESLKNKITQIESDHPFTPRLQREQALIIREIIKQLTGSYPQSVGFDRVKEIDDEIKMLRAQI